MFVLVTPCEKNMLESFNRSRMLQIQLMHSCLQIHGLILSSSPFLHQILGIFSSDTFAGASQK